MPTRKSQAFVSVSEILEISRKCVARTVENQEATPGGGDASGVGIFFAIGVIKNTAKPTWLASLAWTLLKKWNKT
jgi:hypothetical protein